MNRINRLISAFALIAFTRAGVAVAEGPAAPPTSPAISIHKIDIPLTIDGDLKKEAWQKVKPLRVDYVNGKTGELSETPRMTVRYLWDDHYFYIGYEFFTKNLKAQGTGEKEGPAGNQREGAEIHLADKKVDIAEFFITFNEPHFFWELHHNELNQFNDVWCTVPDPKWKVAEQANMPYGIIFGARDILEDEGPFKLSTAVKLLPKADGKPSTVNDPSDVDTGYTAEIRVPWYGLGASKSRRTTVKTPAEKKGDPDTVSPGPWKMEGEELKVLAVYQDDDLPERYHHSAPTKPAGGWFHHSEAYWQTFKLDLSN